MGAALVSAQQTSYGQASEAGSCDFSDATDFEPQIAKGAGAATFLNADDVLGQVMESEAQSISACDLRDAVIVRSSHELLHQVGGRCAATHSCKRVICLAAGDYGDDAETAVAVTRTCSGELPCILRALADTSPWTSDVPARARLRRLSIQASGWIVRGIHVTGVAGFTEPAADSQQQCADSPAQALPRVTIGRSVANVTFDRCLIEKGFGHGIAIAAETSNISVTRNVIRDLEVSFGRDAIGVCVGHRCVKTTSDDQANPPTKPVTFVSIVANEIYDVTDGVQLAGFSSSNPLNGPPAAPPSAYDYQALLITKNDIYVLNHRPTPAQQQTAGKPYAYTENAIDIKNGSSDPALPVVIEDNRLWGFRMTGPENGDACGSSGGSGGEAIVIHQGSDIPFGNIVVRHNLIADSQHGVIAHHQSDVVIESNVLAGISPVTPGSSNTSNLALAIGLTGSGIHRAVAGNLVIDAVPEPNGEPQLYWLLLEDPMLVDTPGPDAWVAKLEDNVVCGAQRVLATANGQVLPIWRNGVTGALSCAGSLSECFASKLSLSGVFQSPGFQSTANSGSKDVASLATGAGDVWETIACPLTLLAPPIRTRNLQRFVAIEL